MDLRGGFADYLLNELGRSPATVRQYLGCLGRIEALVGKPIEAVTADDLRRLKRSVPWASETTKGHVVAVRQFHAWGALEGHWDLDGISLVRTPPVESKNIPPLSRETARALMAACVRPLDYRLVYYPFYAGTRIGESAIIEGSMWVDGFLHFPGEKNRRWRRVPIHPDLEAVRWKLFASEPTQADTLQRVKRRLSARTGIVFVTHQMRKTFASLLYDADVADEVVGEMLGHTGNQTRRYAPVSDRKMIDAMGRLDYGRGQL